jgi:putative ABC transport system substrate-binding protein
VFSATTGREIDAAFADIVQHGIKALHVPAYPLFTNRRAHLTTLAARHAIAATASAREYTDAGFLMSYGPNEADVYRQVGIYTGRILKGEKPDELPVMRPTKFELVINLNTAMALGFMVPPTLLATADVVIE